MKSAPAVRSNGERLAWYAARARAMSPAEIVWRAGSRASAVTATLRRRHLQPVLSGGDTPAAWAAAQHDFRVATARPVLLDAARAAAIAESYPEQAAAVIAAADEVLDRRFAYFGHDPVLLPGPHIDWNYDPRTGFRWPTVNAGRIDHRSQAGDPKWIWELNRLQHLPWLAQAWLFTGDDRYADGALEQLDGWIEQNPPGQGIAWRGAFEVGLRAVSVAVALQGLREADALTPERFRRAVTMLAASIDVGWRTRSLFSSANNHLVGEMAGVATAAMLFPEIAGATQALSRALRVLTREADRQILPDGAGAEQSVAYQIFCAELIVVVAALQRLGGGRPHPALVAALRRSADHLRRLAGDGDPLPRYGDADDGFALRLQPDPLPALDRHLVAVAAVTGTPPARPLDLTAAWLAGPAGTVADEEPTALDPTFYAPHGGLVVLRRGTRRLTMDVGPLGYLSLAAHGHADALAVTLSSGGCDIIGDPGTGSYYGEPAWRDAFRGTRMHATVAVDDVNQSTPGGPFLWTKHAATKVRAVDLARGVVEAEHDGYERLPDPVVHRRYLITPPSWDTVVVVDLVHGSGSHRIRTAWPLHPSCSVREDGPSFVIARDGAPALRVLTLASDAATPYSAFGDEDQRLGWWSDSLESRRPAWLVGSSLEAEHLPAVVATLFTMVPVTDAMLSHWSGVVALRWCEGGVAASVRIDTRHAGAVSVQRCAASAGNQSSE